MPERLQSEEPPSALRDLAQMTYDHLVSMMHKRSIHILIKPQDVSSIERLLQKK